jgi:hypothetical protein
MVVYASEIHGSIRKRRANWKCGPAAGSASSAAIDRMLVANAATSFDIDA